MSTMIIGIGAALCGGGAMSHFNDEARHKEIVLALGGFCCLLVGLFLDQPPHF